jgi:hypothetical protein
LGYLSNCCPDVNEFSPRALVGRARTISGTVAGVIDERDARFRGEGGRNLGAPAR